MAGDRTGGRKDEADPRDDRVAGDRSDVRAAGVATGVAETGGASALGGGATGVVGGARGAKNVVMRPRTGAGAWSAPSTKPQAQSAGRAHTYEPSAR